MRLPFLCLLCVFMDIGWSAFSFPDCGEIKHSDFKPTIIVGKSQSQNPLVHDGSLLEPIDMEFTQDAEGFTNFWVVERRGRIKFINTKDKSMTIAGKVEDLSTTKEDGLVGIVKDPGFDKNRWMYLYYTHKSSSSYRVSRYITKTDNSIDLASEKVIISIPCIISNKVIHTGGAMAFDAFGDMWITVGDNAGMGKNAFVNKSDPVMSSERGPANTKSLLGGILRIRPINFSDDKKPEPGIGRTYTIPNGNFSQHFSEYWKNKSRPGLSQEYANPDKVRPEIYAKGARNPYTITLDPVRQWVAWGDCGPDFAKSYVSEEHNLITEPAFMGWPYFAGKNLKAYGDKPDALAIINDSPFNSGVKDLPPATPALHAYPRNCAMTGPIYRYNGDLKSKMKFPPHFNKAWFLFDSNRGMKGGNTLTKAYKLSEDGKALGEGMDIFPEPHFMLYMPLAIKFGPEGALYIINYDGWFNSRKNTSLIRIEYTGSCHPAEPKLETAGCMDKSYAEFDPNAIASLDGACKTPTFNLQITKKSAGFDIQHTTVRFSNPGFHRLSVFDIHGKRIIQKESNLPADYTLSSKELAPGVYILNILTEAGVFNHTIAAH